MRNLDPGGVSLEAAELGAAREGLDDAHASAIAGTDLGRRLRFGVFRVRRVVARADVARRLSRPVACGDEVSQATDVVGASGAGEEAIVADAVEAVGQHVQEKAADELGDVERHRFDPGPAPRFAANTIFLPAEGDALVVGSDEAAVRDRDAVGVAREIGEDGLRSGEGSLGVDDLLVSVPEISANVS